MLNVMQINSSERYHEYYFGKRTKKCGVKEKSGKAGQKKKKKSKKEEVGMKKRI